MILFKKVYFHKKKSIYILSLVNLTKLVLYILKYRSVSSIFGTYTFFKLLIVILFVVVMKWAALIRTIYIK